MMAERLDRIAGRYVVEASLASGGMGSVYRVRDASSGRLLALKRLLPGSSSTAALLLRREYHTLARLRHPHIIEVYEYGLDAEGPFYTMELLDGQDVGAAAPLAYIDACRCLLEVASALGLLHAHRLLHRDLTPANVRIISDGRCKLIDFGALSPFGAPEAIVGTPPFVPPEALHGRSLDQRADLFSLGALAYYLLTKKNAYPARSFRELETAWTNRPPAPSARLETSQSTIPKALDELVMSMLSLDPMARPSSAAEVIDRLSGIAQLESEVEPEVVQSYLLSARVAGRSVEIERCRALAEGAVAGSGAVAAIEHDAGSGATRLLTEMGLEARVAGATVIELDAEAYRGPYAVAKALAQKLASALPEQARAAATADVLALGWLRALASNADGPSLPPIELAGAPGVWRLRAQAALEKWFLDVADAQPLSILVDNLHRADEASAALLTLLAAAAPDHPLLIITTLRKGEAATAPTAVRQLLAAAERFSLGALTLHDSSFLVRSLFGDVPNVERVSHWLHRLSSGYPRHLMELSRYLVAHGLARYSNGAWSLPKEFPSDAPSRFEDTLDERIAKLSPFAHQLACVLSVHETPLSLELCAALAEAEHGDPFAALDELNTAGVLVGFGTGYRFEQEALRRRFFASLPEEERKRLHRLLGAHLAEVSPTDLATILSAGWHLFYGGEEKRGAELLRGVALDLLRVDDLPEAVPALEAAVAVYSKLGQPRHELLTLLEPLAFAGFYVDRRLADQYGDETLALLSREIGLTLTVRLRPYIGSYLSLVAGLLYAIFLHLFGGRGGLRVLSDRISILGGISCALTATSTICLDREGAARRAAVFEPFSVMGKRHGGAFCHAVAKSLVRLTEDRTGQTIAELRDLLARLDTPMGVMGLPKPMRPIIKGGILFALGALEGFTDPPHAIQRADALEACGLRLYDMVASQIRANYYACQGASNVAREHEKQVEMHAVRNGSAWQAEAWAPTGKVYACIATGDLLGLKRVAEDLEGMLAEIPSFSRIARLARLSLKALRGEYELAIPALEGMLAESEPRSYIGFTPTVGVLAWAYNETGQHARAAALCNRTLEQLGEEDRMVVAMNLQVEIQLALAEAGLARTEAAQQRLDGLLEKHTVNGGAVTLGLLHRARAQVALMAGDRDAVDYSCRQTEYWFRLTENPVLIAQSERVVKLILLSSRPPASAANDATTVDAAPLPFTLLLAACSGPDERGRRVIDIAVETYRAERGWLFGVRDGAVTLLATNGEQAPPSEMATAVRRRIVNMLEEQRTMTLEAEPEQDVLSAYTVIPLALDPSASDGDPRVLGAIVLSGVHVHVASISARFARNLAKRLYESADVSTLRVLP
jgi:hypothetical protein